MIPKDISKFINSSTVPTGGFTFVFISRNLFIFFLKSAPDISNVSPSRTVFKFPATENLLSIRPHGLQIPPELLLESKMLSIRLLLAAS